jgi:hypothetical protein
VQLGEYTKHAGFIGSIHFPAIQRDILLLGQISTLNRLVVGSIPTASTKFFPTVNESDNLLRKDNPRVSAGRKIRPALRVLGVLLVAAGATRLHHSSVATDASNLLSCS